MTYTPGLNGGRINFQIGGNSTSAGAGYSTATSGTVQLAGGNNITLSQNGNSVTISGGAGGGGVAMSAAGGSITSGTASFVNANNISFSVNGQSISGSVLAQSVQTQNMVSVLGSTGNVSFANANGVTFGGNASTLTASISQGGVANAAGTQTATSGTVNFANSNGISFGMSGSSQITASYTVPTQSNQTLSYAATGNTTGNTSGVSFDARSITYQGLGAASVGISTSAGGSSILFSSPAQTVQSQNMFVINDGAATISSGTAVLSDANGISFGINGQTITGSHNGITSQTNQTMNIYGVGNTTAQSSSSSIDARSLSFQGTGGVSVGMSAGSVVISGATGGGLALYDGANSISSGTARFTNANGVSFTFNGQTISGSVNTSYLASNASTNYVQGNAGFNGTNASGTITSNSVSVSVANMFNAGVSTGGNSLGATGTVSNQIVLFAGNNITLSQTTGAGGATVSVVAPNFGTAAQVTTMQQYVHNSAAFYSSSTFNMINASASLARMIIPSGLSFSRVDIPVTISGATSATTNTAAMAISAVGVIYSRNGATLNPIVGQSSTTTYSYASNSGVYSSVTGPRVMSFNLATSLSAGEYYMGLQFSSNTSSVGLSTTNLAWTVAPIIGTSYSVLPFTDMSSGSAITYNALTPLQGVNSVTISNTTQTMQQSQITQSGTVGLRGNFVVMFRNA